MDRAAHGAVRGAAHGQVHVIQGREVGFPVVVRDASSGAAAFAVDAAAARRWLPGPELEVVEAWPGKVLLSLAFIDYRDNDLGDYDEVSVALFVRERGAARGLPVLGPLLQLARGRLGTYIHRLPVTQAFTCEAGRTLWGFPKQVQQIRIERAGGKATCTWEADGGRVLRLVLPCRGGRRLPDSEMVTYSWIGGAAHRTRFVSGAEGFGFRPGGARLELGDHALAAELRAVGLPRGALFSTWMERMHARFEAPEKL
jgi:hypothetical protein